MDVLRKDMRVSEASVRVRAATELLAEERRRRAEREAVTADDRAWRAFLGALTEDERRELNSLTDQLKLAKARVFQRCPEARPAGYVEPTQIATSDYAPGTLFLHKKGAVCEAAPLDEPPPAPQELTEEDINVLAPESDEDYIEVEELRDKDR